MPRSIAALIAERFGVNAVPLVNRSLASVGVAAVQLFRNDPDRLAALLVNLSVNTMFALHTPDVSATKGIRINPSGGTLALIWDEDFDLTGWEWFVVADGLASGLLTVEWVAVDPLRAA